MRPRERVEMLTALPGIPVGDHAEVTVSDNDNGGAS
jgi:hypothetical protein